MAQDLDLPNLQQWKSPLFAIVMPGKQLNTPSSTEKINQLHWWRIIHMKKWMKCDWFCDDQVNKWGPKTMTSFAEAEEQAKHHAETEAGTLGKWWDLDMCNASLENSLRREHKQWGNTMGKSPKPSAISSIDYFPSASLPFLTTHKSQPWSRAWEGGCSATTLFIWWKKNGPCPTIIDPVLQIFWSNLYSTLQSRPFFSILFVNLDAERASVSGREMTTRFYYLDAERLDTSQYIGIT